MSLCFLGNASDYTLLTKIFTDLSGFRFQYADPVHNEISALLNDSTFSGYFVAAPYQKAVTEYMDILSPEAQNVGSVDTVIRRSDGTLLGHNTYPFGFHVLAEKSGISFSDKNVLILGCKCPPPDLSAVLAGLGIHSVAASLSNEDLTAYTNASVIINISRPQEEESADLKQFPNLEGVLDLTSSPCRSKLLMDAESAGIAHMGGLWFTVARAGDAAAFLSGTSIPRTAIDAEYASILREKLNIVLVGMPGCGKTTIGSMLAKKMNRPFADTDTMIVSGSGMTVDEIFRLGGESSFRDSETQILSKLKNKKGYVIATGGGCITQICNYPLLHQNGTIIWLLRDLKKLPLTGRPLSIANGLSTLFSHRKPMYEAFADVSIDNNGTPEETVNRILTYWENAF